MYYRRKILLSLLQVFNNEIDKISLQKLLMLFSKLQSKPDYHFVPYKYGCYSFQANADLSTMVKYRQVAELDKKWLKTDKTDYLLEIKDTDRKALRSIKSLYAGKTKDELIRITYLQYPFFVLNSTISQDVLDETEYQAVELVKPSFSSRVLFTIGYEEKELLNLFNQQFYLMYL